MYSDKDMSAVLQSVQGFKHDDNKERWDLLPVSSIRAVVKVLTYGAKKYGGNNWRKVDDAKNRYYAALLRHITAWREGEAYDPETGEAHLAHAMCNLIFLMEGDYNDKC